jgi:TM2 domain-containing membrane protein YozV
MTESSPPRRQLTLLSQDGLTNLRWQNPLIIVWWSASFPGFGHFLLHNYIRGFMLSLWEVIINRLTHINEAIVYSFSGRIELAKEVLEPLWVLAYMLVYMFAIWDSYLKAIDANKHYHLASMENSKLVPFLIRPLCISYLSLRRPWAAMICSCMIPGLGQLYNNRLALGFYGLFWWIIYMTLSRSHAVLLSLFQGNIQGNAMVLDPQWLLFMPSVIGGAMYDAFMTTRDNNHLFRLEQKQYFSERYPHFQLDLFPKADGEHADY